MPGQIDIPKVYYGNNGAVAGQTFKFEYKLWSAPDSSYINAGTSTVQADGDLNTPVSVTGLPSETLYYVRATNMSCSPGEIYIQQITTV